MSQNEDEKIEDTQKMSQLVEDEINTYIESQTVNSLVVSQNQIEGNQKMSQSVEAENEINTHVEIQTVTQTVGQIVSQNHIEDNEKMSQLVEDEDVS